MKIYKTAQGALGEGEVEIEIVIDEETGTYQTMVVAHGPGTSCGTEDDSKMLSDIVDGDIMDEGHTSEYFEEQREKKQKVKPQKMPEQEESGPFIGGPFGGQKPQEEGRRLDQGFGV